MSRFILLISLSLSLVAFSRDGRLRISDHVLYCNESSLRGMGSDQVAAVLRQTPPAVQLIVARTVDLDNMADLGSATSAVASGERRVYLMKTRYVNWNECVCWRDFTSLFHDETKQLDRVP